MKLLRLSLALLLLAGAAAAQDSDARINAEAKSFGGAVSLFAKNLTTGATFEMASQRRVRTASTIKLAIMTAAFAEVARGHAAWTDRLMLTEAGKVSGSGVLTELSDGVMLPLRDLVHLMIVVSDNTATNLVLDKIPSDTVNAEMQQLGLTQTRSLRKVLSDHNPALETTSRSTEGRKPENKPFGIGVTTTREMAALMEKIYRGEAVSAAASAEMLAILKRQQYHEGIGRTLRQTTIASKSGALDHLRSDVAIVYAKGGPIVMAITVDDIPEVNYTNENPGNLLISRLSLLLLERLGGGVNQ
jgi:beta-lactamase class A